MEYKFLNIFLERQELLNQTTKAINPFLHENNSTQIEKIYEFYKSNVNLLYVNGFLGTGKVEIVEYSTSFLAPETIILKYNCFNSTVLDDILLSFYSEFKKLSEQNIISEPKTKTENFTQKINSYFSQIEKAFVIILDSFEAILEENRREILDFIFHLNSMQKVKIIIIGRVFESKYFKDTVIERVTTSALEKPIFEKYIKSEKIKASSEMLEEFYKHTRGYYFYTMLSVKLMKNENLSLYEYLMKFKNSFLPFHKFLEKQALELVPSSERNLFWLLALIRHPLNKDLLIKLDLYNEEKINFFIENFIIFKEGSLFYAPDYLREEVDESALTSILHRIHRYIIDLYSTQLPLKPLERDICVSRQTMRKEIEYHKLFLPKIPKNIENQALDINYLSYAKIFDFTEDKLEQEKKEKEQKKTATSQSSPAIDLTQRKNISINLENLPFQKKDESPQFREFHEEEENLSLKEILESAKKSEIRYDYAKAVDLYKEALLIKNDPNYANYLPMIYTKLAHAYKKIAKSENALKYYELAQSIYANTQDFIRLNYIKFSIAKIYYETYKIEKAKEIFTEIAQSKESPAVLVVRSYLQLANLEESLPESNAFKYYQLAVDNSDETMSEEILSELYFKYALTLDDKNNTAKAIEFYNKCINLNSSANKFLSAAYSNTATLYLEKNDIENAIKNYEQAYNIDKENNNLEGIYYSSSKLASILQRKQPEKALEYFNIALDCAMLTTDVFYTVSAHLAIGDFHYDKNQNELALKHYMNALDLAKSGFSQDNINKIKIRINDIKFKIGNEQFDRLVEIIKTANNK